MEARFYQYSVTVKDLSRIKSLICLNLSPKSDGKGPVPGRMRPLCLVTARQSRLHGFGVQLAREFSLLFIRFSDSLKFATGRVRRALLLSAVLLLATACNSGNSVDNGNQPPVNRVPSAAAGSDIIVVENTSVTLNGSASDPDPGDSLTFAWSQLSGLTVTLDNANMATASFMAPDVAEGSPAALTFQLTVTDTAGASSSDDVVVTVQNPQASVTISGKVNYEFPPAVSAPICRGLDFANFVVRPIRGATVQVIESGSNAVLGSMQASDTGDFSFTVPGQTDVFLRVRAELKQSGTQTWDVDVRNNVVDPSVPNPPPRSVRPLYVLDGTVFSSGALNSTRNLTAATGWDLGSASYTGVRAAAPFAILDAIYAAVRLIADEDLQASFPPLDAFWSPANNTANGSGSFEQNIDSGEIGTSFYLSDELFLLGMEGDDAEEFDDHVVVHEWGHYFEDNFSRSDSIGGPHGPDDRLDPRVAFGEGFATALSGMVLDDPNYCDTLWFQGDLRGFRIDIEGSTSLFPAWFDELSVLRLLYDLWDTDNDGSDDGSVGFGAIYKVMTGDQAVTDAFTTIFSFAESIKAQNPAAVAFIDAQLTNEGITASNIDRWADSEVNKPQGALDVLPVYTTIVPDGSISEICSNRQYEAASNDFDSTGNKLSEHRFAKFTVGVQRPYRFSLVTTTSVTPEVSDPDMHFFLNGQFQNRFVGNTLQGRSGDANQEIFTTPVSLTPGVYVIDLWEWRYEDDTRPETYPNRVCFDVSITPS